MTTKAWKITQHAIFCVRKCQHMTTKAWKITQHAKSKALPNISDPPSSNNPVVMLPSETYNHVKIEHLFHCCNSIYKSLLYKVIKL